MKQLFLSIFLSLACLLSLNNLFAIEVEGEVCGTWSIDDSPVVVLDTIIIPEDEELTIEPCVIVNFTGPYSLLVYGELLAEGTEDDSIIFHPDEDVESWCGIRADSGASVTLDYCFIGNCSVGDDDTTISGGAVYCDDVELNISNSTFSSNLCSGSGGAIYFCDGISSIERNLFSDNVSTRYGGAIMIAGRQSTVRRNTFTGNQGSEGGGALYVGAETLILDNRFIGNSAIAGGAIRTGLSPGEECVISGNTFISNHAINGGALIIGHLNSIEVHHNVFVRNFASNDGGAVCFRFFTDGTSFYSNTIVFNESVYGGGISDLSNGHPQLVNCIIWGNQADEFPQITFYRELGGAYLTYCLIEDGWVDGFSDHIIDEDPQFVDPDNDDFHLTPDSPCIDAGDPETDPDPDGTRADIGPFFFPQQNIYVEPEVIEFIDVQTGDRAEYELEIWNIGLLPLEISTITLRPDNTPFSIIEGEDVFEIQPDTSHTLVIGFAPEREDTYETTLLIMSNDRDQGELEIPVTGSALDVASADATFPAYFELSTPRPNPFNRSCRIGFSLPHHGFTILELIDTQGRKVVELVSGFLPSGSHVKELRLDDCPAGVYLVRLRHEGRDAVRKVVYLR